MCVMQRESDHCPRRHPPSAEGVTFITAIKHHLRRLVRSTTHHLKLRGRRAEGSSCIHKKPRAIDTSANAPRPASERLLSDKGRGPVSIVHHQPYPTFSLPPLEMMPSLSSFCPFTEVQRSLAMCGTEGKAPDRKKLGRLGEALTSHPLAAFHDG
jgi:hypothetical protein